MRLAVYLGYQRACLQVASSKASYVARKRGSPSGSDCVIRTFELPAYCWLACSIAAIF